MLAQRTRWDSEADVVVVGYGSAGSVAAITAHDAGSQVVILEKQPEQKIVTSSFLSGGVVICPSDVDGGRRYLEALYKVGEGLYWTEPEIIDVWARYSVENVKWMESMGAKTELFVRGGEHNLPGSEAIDVYRVRGLGPGLMRALYGQVKARGIPVIYDTRATTLLTNSRSEVTGVRVSRLADRGKEVNIRARRAVILASGGFEYNEQMKLQYLKVYPCYFTASPALTGDGVGMALDVGAQLWHMNCCSASMIMKFPDFEFGMGPLLGGVNWRSPGTQSVKQTGYDTWYARHHAKLLVSGGYIITDRSGKRFTDENFKGHSVFYELTLFDTHRLIYPRVPSYWIFDQRRLSDGLLAKHSSGPAGPAGLYKWSKDNKAELERGWIKQAGTVKELAVRLGMEPATLAETVNGYNRYCKTGADAEFRRESATLVPLDSPPYYAVELWPGGPNTQGGPRHNANAQVLRADGTPAPRLYCAGELGSIYGMLYPTSGGNLAECIALGRV
ncbi:MAG: FAD-binding protein, partial [Chloroflexota bacterium]